MSLKNKLILILSLSSFFTFTTQSSVEAKNLSVDQKHEESLIHQQEKLVRSLASLVYHAEDLRQTLKNQLENPAEIKTDKESIIFSEEEALELWNKATVALDSLAMFPHYLSQEKKFQEAYDHYHLANAYLSFKQTSQAQLALEQSSLVLSQVWEQAAEDTLISRGLPYDSITETLLRKKQGNYLEEIDCIPPKIKNKISPHLLPHHHRMKFFLDSIFCQNRVTLDERSIQNAGFATVSIRPRTHIHVLRHALLPGYLIKANLDNDFHKKQGRPSWEWLVKRCEGAEKIARIIKEKKIKHFTVANKWIYPLPDKPAPPKSSKYMRHLAVLLVTDMELTPNSENLDAWRHKITERHLDELYTVLSYARGSSYRPDNISYTIHHQFAFVDTEYPSRGPDFTSIRPHLRLDMQMYWDKLIRNGGN